jgi:hypothetical protein
MRRTTERVGCMSCVPGETGFHPQAELATRARLPGSVPAARAGQGRFLNIDLAFPNRRDVL